MANTYIDTNKLPHTKTPGSGEFVEVLNNALCGAKNVVGTLRWVKAARQYDAANDARTNQLIYLMEGEAHHHAERESRTTWRKGNGIYLGPSESASIAQRGTAPLKLFQLVVPKQGA